jgi:hypothetical protein
LFANIIKLLILIYFFFFFFFFIILRLNNNGLSLLLPELAPRNTSTKIV